MKTLLAVIAAALCGVLFLQWNNWRPTPPTEAELLPGAAITPSSPEPPTAGDLLLSSPPKEDYASVGERPLFLPDRRPPPDEPEGEEAEPEEASDLAGTDLNAVLITPALVSAWVQTPSSSELVRLRLGDDFEGWTVSTIEPDRLVLERQGETNELILRDYASMRAAPPQAAPRRQTRRAPVPTRQRGSSTVDQGANAQGESKRLPRPPATRPASRQPPRPDQKR